MTMFAHIPCPAATAFAAARGFAVVLVRLRRLVNGWVASAIARRERQAALMALHYLNDRELKDFGLYRCEINDALSHAAEMRKANSQSRVEPSAMSKDITKPMAHVRRDLE